MKILYGVVGEGMGHAIRSRVVLEHLFASGHEVEVMASGRAVEFLKKHFPEVHRIHGLHMVYEENRFRIGKSIVANFISGAASLPKSIGAYFELLRDFNPGLVITDFESWTYIFAKLHNLPVLCIDNMHVLSRCRLPEEIVAPFRADFEVTKAFIKGKLPFCDHYFVTTFFYPEVRKPNTTLVPPILRSEILNAKPTPGKHLLVYQTAEGYGGLADLLRTTGVECRIYGARRGITAEETEGNLRYMPFSEENFIADMASAWAVLAGGGFTTMGEAVFLRKPMLSLPLRSQYEQVANALFLEKEGFGMALMDVGDRTKFDKFVSQVDVLKKNLERYTQTGNTELFGALDGWLDRASAGLL